MSRRLHAGFPVDFKLGKLGLDDAPMKTTWARFVISGCLRLQVATARVPLDTYLGNYLDAVIETARVHIDRPFFRHYPARKWSCGGSRSEATRYSSIYEVKGPMGGDRTLPGA